MIKEIERRSGLDVEKVSLENYLGQTKAQIMLVHDEHDRIISINSAREIVNLVNVNELLITKELGHVMILREPETINKVLKFVNNE